MSNSIFDFLNFDFDDFAKKLEEWKSAASNKYNDFVNDNIKKYDLNTQEGYEAFIKEAADIRTQLVNSDSIFSKKLVELLDTMVEKAMKNHTENVENNKNENKPLPKTDKVNDIVRTEVDRSINENHNHINTGKKEYISPVVEEKDVDIDWPSEALTPKQKRNVWKLVDEYMDTKVIPYLDDDFDEDMVDDMSSGLFEFAAWILTKEED